MRVVLDCLFPPSDDPNVGRSANGFAGDFAVVSLNKVSALRPRLSLPSICACRRLSKEDRDAFVLF